MCEHQVCGEKVHLISSSLAVAVFNTISRMGALLHGRPMTMSNAACKASRARQWWRQPDEDKGSRQVNFSIHKHRIFGEVS